MKIRGSEVKIRDGFLYVDGCLYGEVITLYASNSPIPIYAEDASEEDFYNGKYAELMTARDVLAAIKERGEQK